MNQHVAPPPPRYSIQVDRGVMIPMRDGTRLAADVYRPAAPGRFPAVVERTPYNREQSVILRTGTPQFMAERGLAFVVQDVRGRFGSEGVWFPFVDDGWGPNRDGYDTIAWVAAQGWCNGRVGTAGGSYAGQTQMLLAPTRPPALRCAMVREAASSLARQWAYRGGAFEWAFNLDWCMRHAVPEARRQADVLERLAGRSPTRFDGLPLGTGPGITDPFRWLHAMLAHPDDGPFWEPFDIERQYSQIDVPMLHLAGWFDIFLEGTLRNFQGLQASARTARARKAQRLVIGPWTHGPSVHDEAFARWVGEMDFGPQATFDYNGELWRWCAHWLCDEPTGVLDTPAVRYFLMGANEWRTSTTWPPSEVVPQRWYLHSEVGGRGRRYAAPAGGLSPSRPGEEPPAILTHDPARPVPSIGGNTLYYGVRRDASGEENPDFSLTAGPRDQREIEALGLVYTSPPLAEDLDVVGPVKLVLYAASNRVDTDFVARLTDVFPDGRSILVTDGIVRARYRRSRRRPELLVPGRIYRFVIDLWHTAWRFAAGHRLRLAVAGSCFPRYDRNLNTGEPPDRSARMLVAANRVYHDRRRPSHLVLSVLR
jgi:putative CocE/NonD family hydrolase